MRAAPALVLALALAPAVAAVLAGCSPARAPSPGLTAAVSIPPQAWALQIIGGGRLEVLTAVAPGQSPHTFDPSPRQMADLAQARLYVACGAPMENTLLPRLRASYPRMRISDVSAGQRRLSMPAHGHDEHPGEPEATGGPHGDGQELDPHLWLDPSLMARQTLAMAAELAEVDPERAVLYRARGDSLAAELTKLDAELCALLADVKGREFFVFHPAFGYFAAAYGLHQTAIEQGGIDPSPRHLAEVLGRIKAKGARAVFVQPQFSLGSARAVARDTGVELVVLDPLAFDYPDNMRRMASLIRQALLKEASDGR